MVYLARLRIFDTPLVGLYLHDIDGLDPQPDPHDHPWPFLSLVLSGGYLEDMFERYLGRTWVKKRRYWRKGSVHLMWPHGQAHRIIGVHHGTRTLILRGPRLGEWGFYSLVQEGSNLYRMDRWTNWKDYLK